MIATDGIETFVDAWSTRLRMPLPLGIRDIYLANDANDPQAIVAYLRRAQREPSHEAALARMTMPVLLFAGEHDPDCLLDSHIAAVRLPGATLTIIPGENHTSTIARADKVLPHVLAFLARVTGSQSQAA